MIGGPGRPDLPGRSQAAQGVPPASDHEVPRLFAASLCALLALSAPALPRAGQPPANATPASPDPATVSFTSDVGMLLVAVKPDRVADYEAVVRALQTAMAAQTDPGIRRLAEGWRVFKATDVDAKANAIYIHLLQPAVAGVDYRPSLWLDKLLEGAPADLLAKYRDAFATAPTRLGLAEFAQMSVAPVNATPGAPDAAPAPGAKPPESVRKPPP